MKVLFLGDIVGQSGCMVVKQDLKKIVEENKINFVIANGETLLIGVYANTYRKIESSAKAPDFDIKPKKLPKGLI